MKHLKKKIVELTVKSNEGHIPSAFSVLDILWVLYDRILNISPQQIEDPQRDRFILSKGHSSLGLYVVLAKKGFIETETLDSFGEFNSILGGHPDRTKIPGVEASTGSLGHGLPMAVGLALGMKIKKQKNKVYTIIGDGECNEGSIWESILLATHHKLNNLFCIVDYNHSGDRALTFKDLQKQFEAFGCKTISINGHDQEEIYNTLKEESSDRPTVIIANTTKGHGSKIMENNPAWHHKAPSHDELNQIINELNQHYA